MFRKPKKTAKAALRSRGRNKGEDLEGGGDSRPAKRFRKRTSGDDGDGSSSDDDEGQTTADLLAQLRKEKDGGKSKKVRGGDGEIDAVGGGGLMHEFRSSDPSDRMTAKDMATRAAEHHPTKAGSAGGGEDLAGDNSGAYRGSAQPRNKFLAGPMKAPTFVRTTCRFDYQPDICKDYKDTGFCGFGDTCIYLHDRGDTLTGWQMEQQWEEQKKKERERKEREMDQFLERASRGDAAEPGDDNEEDDVGNKDKRDDGIPFACHICRGPFNDPVVTSCGHYFCEGCIMAKVKGESEKSGVGPASACPICGKDTHGVFNHPSKLIAKKRRTVGSDGTWEEFSEVSRKK
eukprot:CAMPEP_0183302226 /NCGR_PEP_ID=MMETSP0160_2-20130417/8088_1 /TAXON_ID=2839 ORGANISM="Odontella Sinensis, Strain Grunow 1884" /NCGR_SAMPLE_ID=MMETSP0160_2 /ASSEMBLY_ACC=CAM_ASM_000250 /LENGTH=344 /DNA_ID=CAMNT_0025464971 /DNA_START=25 /DNA_END=1059 /DNA_ORIENTATION=-